MSTISTIMAAGAFLPPMIAALHSFHAVWRRIGAFGRDFKDIRDTLRIEECRFGEVLNCDMSMLVSVGDRAETVRSVNRQLINIQSHLDNCHALIDWHDKEGNRRDPEQQGSGPELLQSSTGFPRRTKWAILDWQKLHDSLEHIRTSIDGLHSLLRLEYPHSPRLPSSEQRQAANVVLSPVRAALDRLHHSVSQLRRARRRYYRLDVRLREHWDSTRAELSRLAAFEARSGSYIFSLQVSEQNNPSKLVLVDTQTVPNSQKNDCSITQLPQLYEYDDLTKDSVAQSGILETCGYIQTPQSRCVSNDVHIVYRVLDFWKSPLNLADMLSDPAYKEYMSPIQVIWLAKLLISSHLAFLPIQRQLNVQPRPSDCRFYQPAEESFKPWAQDESLILNPYLSIGFGTDQDANYGGPSDFYYPPYASVVELGLVL